MVDSRLRFSLDGCFPGSFLVWMLRIRPVTDLGSMTKKIVEKVAFLTQNAAKFFSYPKKSVRTGQNSCIKSTPVVFLKVVWGQYYGAIFSYFYQFTNVSMLKNRTRGTQRPVLKANFCSLTCKTRPNPCRFVTSCESKQA
jgi:hypothetical protein